MALALLSLAFGPPAVRLAIASKAANNSESLSDRGFASAGSHGRTAGEINLLSTWNASHAHSVPIILALLLLAVVAVRSVRGLSLNLPFLLTTIAVQPTMWMPGAWLIMTMCLIVSEPTVRPRLRGAASPNPSTRRAQELL